MEPFAQSELIVRVGCFMTVFLVMAVLEMLAPRRRQAVNRWARWPGNLLVAIVNSLLIRVLAPTTLIGVAVVADAWGWGLLNLVQTPSWLAVLVAVIALDLIVYVQHILFHVIPPLWRVHRMHHADLEFDVTTGLRFHPIEALLSMLFKCAAVAVLGVPVLAVLIFEVLLSSTSVFNHANVCLPISLDRGLRWFVVTPDMHRVHHSSRPSEIRCNFGFNLPWWDRLFGTYRAQPARGHAAMEVGVEQFRSVSELRFDQMLMQPFRSDASLR